jgi:hypothetical protein
MHHYESSFVFVTINFSSKIKLPKLLLINALKNVIQIIIVEI